MSKKIKIECKGFEVEAELLEDKSPETCEAILDALPFEGEAKVWKEEVYFSIPVDIKPENLSPTVKLGDISYWPEGPAFCIFYGVSQPVSPVDTFAKIKNGAEKFQEVKAEDKITVKETK